MAKHSARWPGSKCFADLLLLLSAAACAWPRSAAIPDTPASAFPASRSTHAPPGIIEEFSAQQTHGLADLLAKARAIYDYVVATLRYDKSGTGWGNGDAIRACPAKRGNCTDFHSLLIGMMRAAGIPARFEIGFPLPEEQHDGAVPGYHCWAEFYVEPYGWIPVDASEAWKHQDKKDYFLGEHDANRVQFTVGRDIRLDPPQQGAPLHYFIYPYAEQDGKPSPWPPSSRSTTARTPTIETRKTMANPGQFRANGDMQRATRTAARLASF